MPNNTKLEEVKIVVKAQVEVTDEIREGVEEQYGNLSDKEIATTILSIVARDGIFNTNYKGTYWDGVAKIENTIKEYVVNEEVE